MQVIILARKPFGQTLCNNLSQYQTGAINIQSLRTKTGDETHGSKPDYQPNKKNAVYGKGMGGGSWENTQGRWPSNIILVHKAECKQEGDVGYTCSRFSTGKGRGSNQIYHPYNRDPNAVRKGYGGSEGVEVVKSWVCVEGCSGAQIEPQYARYFKQIKRGS